MRRSGLILESAADLHAMRHGCLYCVMLIIAFCAVLPRASAVDPPVQKAAPRIDSSVSQLVRSYCLDCHNPKARKGNLNLQGMLQHDVDGHIESWETVLEMLREREMPPEGKPRPDTDTYQAAIRSLDATIRTASNGRTHDPSPDRSWHEVIDRYCISCHNGSESKGNLDLAALRTASLTQHTGAWERVVRKLRARQMPPVGKPRPAADQYERLILHLTTTLDRASRDNPQPGRTASFRRLNRTEYQNAIRDLLDLEIDAAALLPADEASHGFDNVTVGDLPPALLTRYVDAAQKISRMAIGAPRPQMQGHTYRIAPDVTQEHHVPGLPLGTRGGKLLRHTFAGDGEYEIQINLTRDRNEHVEGLHEPHELQIILDRRLVASFTVRPPRNKRNYHFDDSQLNARISVTSGPHELGVTFVDKQSSLIETKRQPLNARFNFHRHPRLTPAIYQISITGPYPPGERGSNSDPTALAPSRQDTPSRRRVFREYPASSEHEDSAAKRIIARLAKLAYRRPVNRDDLQRPLSFYREASAEHGFEAGIEMALSAILVSPRFLFRIERDPPHVKPGQVYEISDGELASRLSFFLWSSIPDEQLLDVAQRGQLSDPEFLHQEIQRMLADSRSDSLATNFASQWLYLRNLDAKTPDARLFPDFDDNLRQAFRQETELFFRSVMREDRSVLDLLKADYTFLNERLARHYGIAHVYGSRFRRMNLTDDSRRGGLLRHGSILTVTSYATRTSPVIRGNWVLENLLGTPAPPPPADVPSLDEVAIGPDVSMRERLAAHRANAACASCHDLMDPIGFALENYDAVGRWRDREGGLPIDTSGSFPDGREFDGVGELEQTVLERGDMFVSIMCEKLLTYALGRGIEHHDAPAVRQIVRSAESQNYRFSAIIRAVIESQPFRMRSAL